MDLNGTYYLDMEFVFTRVNEMPMSQESVHFRRDLSPLCGFTITPHMFRHTQVSMLIVNGMPHYLQC